MPDQPDFAAHWSLHPSVSLRDESFGAMAYHHGNRRLVFLKSPLLVDVVRQLDDFESADAALDALVADEQRAALRRALETLTSSEIVRVG